MATYAADDVSLYRLPVTESLLEDIGLDVETVCADQSIENLRRYPVLTEGGWFLVIVNQNTLEEIHRCQWRLLGPIELLSHGLDPC
ncbi:MAG: hypothetical protein KDE63_00075 [Novosphingobium sp.]|nr:hypothetical protein [Novosphingobium sp.]